MLWSIHVSIYDMVFAANQHTRWPIITVGRRQLTTRDLNEKVRSWVRWLTPFADNVIQAEVEFVICEHLCEDA